LFDSTKATIYNFNTYKQKGRVFKMKKLALALVAMLTVACKKAQQPKQTTQPADTTQVQPAESTQVQDTTATK